MRIAIDFNNTLFPTLEKAVEISNNQFATNIQLSQITAIDIYECLSSEIADKLTMLFVDKSIYDNLRPYQGAVKSIKALIAQGHEIYIVTSAQAEDIEWQERLIQQYLPFIPKDNLIRICNKSLLNVDILIDDDLSVLTQTFADRVCFDQPWNRDEIKDYVYGIHRVHCWENCTID